MLPLVAFAAGFSTSHIALTAAITGVVALVACVLLLGRRRSGLVDSLAIAALAAGAVFLWRKSANMPQLNDDGLAPLRVLAADHRRVCRDRVRSVALG